MWLSGGQIQFGKTRNVLTSTEVDTKLTESGFVTGDGFAEMFSTKVLGEDIEEGDTVKDKLSSFIRTEAGDVTISGDNIFFDGATYIDGQLEITNGQLKVSEALIDKCTVTNVTVQGSMKSPFVLDKDSEEMDRTYYDNFTIHGYDLDYLTGTPTHNLKWTPNQSGRKITIANYKWDNKIPKGTVQLSVPSNFSITSTGSWQREVGIIPYQEDFKSLELEYFEAYTRNVHWPRSTMIDNKSTCFKFIVPVPEDDTFTFYVKIETTLEDEYDNDDDNCLLVVSTLSHLGDKYFINAFNNMLDDFDTHPPTDCFYKDGSGVSHNALKQVIKTSDNGYTPIVFTQDEISKKQNRAEVTIAIKQQYNGSAIHKATIVIPKSSKGTQFFYENGKPRETIRLSREIINLTGYGDDKNFYGWIVENRKDIDTNKHYGKEAKVLAWGKLIINNGKIDEGSNFKTYDNTMIEITKVDKTTGQWTLKFDDDWSDTLSQCFMFVVPFDIDGHAYATYQSSDNNFLIKLRKVLEYASYN